MVNTGDRRPPSGPLPLDSVPLSSPVAKFGESSQGDGGDPSDPRLTRSVIGRRTRRYGNSVSPLTTGEVLRVRRTPV